MSKVEILGVKIDNLSTQEILEKSDQFLSSNNQYYVVTPNPEFLVAAQKDHSFKEILNYADIAVADGVGLIYASKFLKKKLQRVTGADLMWYLCELAEQKSYPVYLLGAKTGVAKKAAEVIKKSFPNIQIVGAESGGYVDLKLEETSSKIIESINTARPKILFVAFGQVKQEKWIFHYLDKIQSVNLAIGVGGTFDYISGQVLRAPEIIRNLGFEWLYRLIKEPRRWKRIYNAVIIFPLLVIKEKILNKFKKEKVYE